MTNDMAKFSASSFYARRHNHNACVHSALNKAQHICAEKALRFTRIRQQILELIWSSHKPVLAYELLRTLRREKRNAEPPTVYRALDFLLQHQLIHKIESLNAYVGCACPDKNHISQFLICTQCHQIAEMEDANVSQVIARQAARSGFQAAQQTVEIRGLCPTCRKP
ncbi:Fur family transcriptional regulator [Candidatus Spongiihabitans sp.]|uniref:Fur family transcriptional regulator n=1 Tax=Candidatus Spongiihabitans sp. TaxID=3101308 RepID=UPI003C7C9522